MLCYNVPFGSGRLSFDVGSDVGPALEAMGSNTFSTSGVSTIADPSNIPDALASSMADSDGFRTAGGTVGLLPVDCFKAAASLSFLAL